MPKKGENIRKRKDGRWEGRYKKGIKENGKILYGSVYGKSYREVKEKIQIALSAPTVITPNQTEIDIKKQVPSEMTLRTRRASQEEGVRIHQLAAEPSLYFLQNSA